MFIESQPIRKRPAYPNHLGSARAGHGPGMAHAWTHAHSTVHILTKFSSSLIYIEIFTSRNKSRKTSVTNLYQHSSHIPKRKKRKTLDLNVKFFSRENTEEAT